MSDRMRKTLEYIKVLKPIMSPRQLSVMGDGCRIRGEKDFFFDAFAQLATTFVNMPKTYDQDGKGNKAVAYLHYFTPSMDFYITEKDMYEEQHQAFGLVVTPHGSELGYISLIELAENNAEIDLHFEPTTIGEIKEKHK